MTLLFTRLRRLFLGIVSTLMAQLNKLAFVTAPVFYQLVYMAFSAGCIVAVMSVIRKFFDKKISPVWKMAMWAMVLAALIIPWRPVSRVSAMKDAQKLQTVSYRGEYDRADMELHRMMTSNRPVPDDALLQAIEKEKQLYAKSRIFDVFLPVIWLGGVAVSCIWHIISAHRLKRKIHLHTVVNDRYYDIAVRCAQLLGMKRSPRIITQNYINSPAVTGLVRPVVLLPEHIHSCDERTVKNILLHEMAHIKRGDMVLNSLIVLLHIVYWPVAWLLLHGIRQDMELANDAAVIKLLDGDRQKEYSRSLVYVLANTADKQAHGRIMYMADGTKNIRRRIEMIKQSAFFTKYRTLIAIVCAVLVFALSAVFLTESPMPEEDNGGISDGHNYYHPLPEDGSMQNHVISYPLPESDEYTGDPAKKYATVAVQLPSGITAGPAPNENRAPIGDFSSAYYYYKQPESLENLYRWYTMENLVCYVGFNTYRPYMGEIPDEDYYKSVWPGLRLSSFANWEPFTSVKNDGNVESGAVKIWSKDPAEIENYPGRMPDVPVMETEGVLAYSRELEIYIGIAFMPGQITQQQAEYIAGTVEIYSENPQI